MPVGSLVAYLTVDGATKASADITGVQRSLDLTGSSATVMGAKTDAAMSGAAMSSSKLQAATLRATAASERYNVLLDSGAASTGRLASAEASLISANMRVASTTFAMNTAMEETVAVAGDSALAGVLRRSGEAASGMGRGFLSLIKTVSPIQNDFALAGLAIAAVGGVTIHAAEQFQDATKKIQTQAGLSAGQVSVLSKGMLDMAASVGTGATTLADAGYHIASVGLRGAQALDVLRTAAEGAKIGGADLTDVTNGLDAAVVSGIKGVDNYQQAMGNLNATVGAGDMSMQDLSDALGTGILAKAKGVGLALIDVDAALATLGDNNIRGSEAATKLGTAFMMMETPSAKAKGALESVGLASTSMGDDMRKPDGLMVALTDLQTHLAASGKTATEQAQVISEAFGGAKTAGTVEILLQQLGRLQSKYDDIDKGSKSFAANWKEYQQTFSYTVSEIKAGAETLGIELGDKLLPVATAALGWIGTDGVKYVGALGDGLGKILDDIGPVAPAFAEAGHVISDVLADLKPLGEVVGGIGFGALAASAFALGEGLRLTGDALSAVDVVLRDAKPEVEGLVLALAALKVASLVPSVAELTTAFTAMKAALGGQEMAAGLTGLSNASATLGASARGAALSLGDRAGGMAASLGAMVTPAGLATVALGLAAYEVYELFNRTDAADKAAKTYITTLGTIDPSKYQGFAGMAASVEAQRSKLQELVGTYGDLKTASAAGYMGIATSQQDISALMADTGMGAEAATKAASQAQAALDRLNATSGAAVTNASALGLQFHLTADQALTLANASGISLTGALGAVRGQFGALALAQIAAATPAGQLKAAEQTLGSAISTAAQKADALSTALGLLSGNSIGAEKAQDDVTIAIANLGKNLDGSSRSLVGNTVAAATNREGLLGLFNQIEQVSPAQIKAAGGADAAAASYGRNYTAALVSAKANGLNMASVMALIAQYHLTPAEVSTVIHANAGPAIAAIGTVNTSLNGLANIGIVDGTKLGANFAQGIGVGITANIRTVTAAALGLVASVHESTNNMIGARSPSRLLADTTGKWFAQGIGVGITENTDFVTAAAATMMSRAAAATNVTVPSAGIAAGISHVSSAASAMAGAALLTPAVPTLASAVAGLPASVVTPTVNSAAYMRPSVASPAVNVGTSPAVSGSGPTVQTRLVIEGNVYGDQSLIDRVTALLEQHDEQTHRAFAMA